MVFVRNNLLAAFLLLSAPALSAANKTTGMIPVSGGNGNGNSGNNNNNNNNNNNMQEPEPECKTIPELACSTQGLETLCDLVGQSGLADALSDPAASLTVFAPTNDAFAALPADVLEAVTSDVDILVNVLLLHVTAATISSGDLQCEGELLMLNGQETTTKCDGSNFFQTGLGNSKPNIPLIVGTDIPACGAKLVHLIDSVILPSSLEPLPPPAMATMPNPEDEPVDYCNLFGPDFFCFKQGHPACCFDETLVCPPAPPDCDFDPSKDGVDYCGLEADEGCYETGKPSCCFDDAVECPTMPPPCDGGDNQDGNLLGANYCTFAPDYNCYIETGKPSCCFDDAAECPTMPSPCDGGDNQEGNLFGANYCTFAPDYNCYIETGKPSCCFDDAAECPTMPSPCDGNDEEKEDKEEEDEYFAENQDKEEEDESLPSIADLACTVPQFSTLCELVILAGLADVLDDPQNSFTVFAPTNDAFDNLPVSLIAELTTNVDLLAGVLLEHVVLGEVFSYDLECTKMVEMFSGGNTRTKCLGPNSDLYQVGAGNTEKIGLPKVTAADIQGGNGVIHQIDQVILPEGIYVEDLNPHDSVDEMEDIPYPDDVHHDSDKCETSIADLACSVPELSTLCDLVIQAGLGETLDNPEASFTVFAPSNDAFGKLPEPLLVAVTTDNDLLTDVLLTHVVDGQVFSFDLGCNQKTMMINGAYTYTKCLGPSDDLYQVGGGNTQNSGLPMIVTTDIAACNGVVHLVDMVILSDGVVVDDVHPVEVHDQKQPIPVNPNIINYCSFEPNNECYELGKPRCCLVEGLICPIQQPVCNINYPPVNNNGLRGNPNYCSFQPNHECYQLGRPRCCFNNQLRCPAGPPVCDRKPSGGSYGYGNGNGYGANQYGNGYGNNQYGNGYGNNQYGNGYGNNQYGNSYGNNQYGNGYGPNQYGNNNYGNNHYGYNHYGNYHYGNNQYSYNQYGSNPYGPTQYHHSNHGGANLGYKHVAQWQH